MGEHLQSKMVNAIPMTVESIELEGNQKRYTDFLANTYIFDLCAPKGMFLVRAYNLFAENLISSRSGKRKLNVPEDPFC